jgi:8-oxo-dGTP diphosphatase
MKTSILALSADATVEHDGDAAADPVRPTLKLLSYNIQVGIATRSRSAYLTHGWKHFLHFPERHRNLDRIAAIMSGYDIVGVQETDAGSNQEWIGPDADRPLSAVGWRQAKGLVGLLGTFPAARLLTSPALRCRQTVAPLVAAYGLDAEGVVELGTDSNIDRLLGLLEAPETRGAVLCTHGEAFRSLMDRLGGRGTVDPAGDRQWDKGATCILKGDPRSRLSVSYLPPAVPLAAGRSNYELEQPDGSISSHRDLCRRSGL